MRRLPAEWEKQSFVQLSFPHAHSDWGYMLKEIQKCYIEIVNRISPFQKVLLICDDSEIVKSFFRNHDNIQFVQIEINDTWIRDYGGITVLEENKPHIMDFTFNGWGNKFEATLDNHVTSKLFKMNIFKNSSLHQINFVLEGGSIESDGKGTILTTSRCLLSENRNGQTWKRDIESKLSEYLGAKRILWIDDGYLAGDDTDSHIDTLARFCNEDTIAFVGCGNEKDEHFESLQKMKDQLQTFRQINGKPYKLMELPMPQPCFDDEGNRLPATYANFLILNKTVLVPQYCVPEDRMALDILESCFLDRKVEGIGCLPLIKQHGSLHCATMQYPESLILNF